MTTNTTLVVHRLKRLFPLLIFTYLISSASFAQQFSKKIVAGFYPYTKDYILKPENIKTNSLTHLIYAFAFPRADGSIGTETGSYHNPALVTRVHADGGKFIVMMGGGIQSGGFHDMAASATARTAFINNLVEWFKTYGYDGVNIDWEYPGDNNKIEDKENLNLLVKEMRTAFNKAGTEQGKYFEISIDVHSSLYYAQWVDFATLKADIDWFGLMSYDYSGNWAYSTHAAHNAPLYCGPDSICSRYLSVDSGVKNIRDELGIPANKIVMGVAFYGREFFNSALYQTPREGGEGEPYYDIKPLIGNGYTRYWDDQSKVPYLLKTGGGAGFISYDDEQSLKLKADYIKENQLLGAMIWEITQDVDKETKAQPLLETLRVNLIGADNNTAGTPQVSITSPTAGYVFTPGSNVTISANAVVESGYTIQKVEFYRDGILLGTDNAGPYTYTWTNVPNGKYTLKAKAYSSAGKTAESAIVMITDGVVPQLTEMWDDFNYANSSDVELPRINKWYVVNGVDGPPAGAVYAKEGITFYPDPSNSANKFMGVSTIASNDPTKNRHARIETSEMPYRNGTFAARVYFDDTPAQYQDANVETFYTINSYATCNNPDLYSEVDFEYLPWDAWHWERKTTMYYTSWETCEIRDHVKSVQSFAGWHDLVYTVAEGQPVKWYIDGQLMGTMNMHTPDSDVNISFANWIYQNTTGSSTATRTTTMQVDWVYHAKDVVITPGEVLQKVASLRQGKILRRNLKGEQVIDGNANPAPTVTITSPSNNANFNSPATIAISATANDTNGTVAKVEFYNGTTKIGEDLTAPYSFSWTNVATGNYSLSAKAIDNAGAAGSSSTVNITVGNVSNNVPPTVSLTAPTNGRVYTAPATVHLAATATDAAPGRVVRVEFFHGSVKIGQRTISPYTLTWSNVSAGTYTITAKATDDQGAVTTSASRTITVNGGSTNTPPTISLTSPANGSSFGAPASITISANASDTAPGTVSKVEFFNGASKLGEDLTAPYSYTWTAVAAGNYSVTAKATDNTGLSSTSAPIQFTVGVVTPGQLEAVYKTIAQWGTGFQGEVRVYNRGTSTVNGWTVQFDCPHNLTPVWDAVILSHVGTKYTIGSTSTTQTIAAGQSIAFGFLGIINSGQAFTPPTNVSSKSGASARSNTENENTTVVSTYPNPSTGITHIEFVLEKESKVELKIYNNEGALATTLINKKLPSGLNKATWDGSRHGAGLFFYQLRVNNKIMSDKILLK